METLSGTSAPSYPSDWGAPSGVEGNAANPPSQPSVAPLPVDDFEVRWTAFTSRNPASGDNAAYKALARLGYCWAVLHFQKLASEAHPK